MTGITEEEKYRCKSVLLQRALATADEMDKKDAENEKRDSRTPTKKPCQDMP